MSTATRQPPADSRRPGPRRRDGTSGSDSPETAGSTDGADRSGSPEAALSDKQAASSGGGSGRGVLVAYAVTAASGTAATGVSADPVALRVFGAAMWLGAGVAATALALRRTGAPTPRIGSPTRNDNGLPHQPFATPPTGTAAPTRAKAMLFLAALTNFLLGVSLTGVLIGGVGMVLGLVLLGQAVRPVSARLRKVLLAVHLACSGCWLGVAVVMVFLALLGATSADPDMRSSAYTFMALFDSSILPLSSISATLTGVFFAYVSKWGVLRHRWLVVKLGLALAIFVAAFAYLHDAVLRAMEAAENGHVPASHTGWLAAAFLATLVALLAATVISVYKPWGRTRSGRN